MTQRVRAKFFCASRTEVLSSRYENGQNIPTTLYSVRFHPVTGGSEENKRFYASTPGGSIEMTGLSEEVGLLFQLSKEYYLDFTLAEAPAAQAA